MSLADWLVIGGVAFEVAGLGTVAVDLHRTARQVRDYTSRPITLEVGDAFSVEEAASVEVVGGQPPTTAERVQQLERRVDELAETLRRLRAEMRQVVDATVERTTRRLQDQQGAMDQLVRGTTAGPLGWRVFGVAMFLVGVLVNAAGNLLG